MTTLNTNLQLERTQQGYDISIVCPTGENEQTTISFTAVPIHSLTKDSGYRSYAEELEGGNSRWCCDIQPLNAALKKRFLKSFLRPCMIRDLQGQLTYLDRSDLKQPVVLSVLDVKDGQGSYNNLKEIESCEHEFAQFLQGNEPKARGAIQAYHRLVRSRGIGYIIQEGKLKNRILSQISSHEAAAFLQTKAGAGLLCQLCEIIMNAFKMGYAVQGKSRLHPEDYFLSTRESPSSTGPLRLKKIHNVSLMTLYPECYRKLYSPSEEYFLAIKNTFNPRHDYDNATQTTAISIIQ